MVAGWGFLEYLKERKRANMNRRKKGNRRLKKIWIRYLEPKVSEEKKRFFE